MLLFLGWALAADGAALAALGELPAQAQALRDNGLDASEVDALIAAIGRAGLPPGDAVALVAHAARVVQENPPIDGFAAFVARQLDEGARGEALQQAIEAAHTGANPPAPAAEPTPTQPAPTKPAPTRPTPRPRPTMTRGPGRRGASGR